MLLADAARPADQALYRLTAIVALICPSDGIVCILPVLFDKLLRVLLDLHQACHLQDEFQCVRVELFCRYDLTHYNHRPNARVIRDMFRDFNFPGIFSSASIADSIGAISKPSRP